MEFRVEDPITTLTGNAWGSCIETLKGESLYEAGSKHYVQDVINRILIPCDQWLLYRQILAAPPIRKKIRNGDLIMCTGKWCYEGLEQTQIEEFLVSTNRNLCGRVVPGENGVKNVGTKPTKVDTFALTVINDASTFSFDQKVHIIGILASV